MTGLKEGFKVSIISILGNILLSIFKLIAGIIGKSNAMISDSIHSISDVLSTVVVIIGLKIASKEEDKHHPYGHERFECVAASILSIFLFITGILIGYNGVYHVFIMNYQNIKVPTLLALIAAIVSIIVKESMYWYTRNVAKKIHSDSLMADAWHHRSDALSSIGSFIGIFGSMLGFKLLDPIASILISFCILKVSYDIMKDAIDKMVDKSCSDDYVDALKTFILDIPGVLTIDSIKTRLFGNRVYVDLEIGADSNLTLKDSHQIAQEVHDHVEEKFLDVKHCMVHMNPYE